MSSYKWDELDPFTQRQIKLQPWDLDYSSDPLVLRSCGCERMREGRWSLCRYHEGVEDGSQNVDEKGLRLTIERLTALGDAMCTAARNTDYAMLHEACSAWEQR